MNSISKKLILVFLITLIVPLVTGINGMVTVRNTQQTLNENGKSLQELTNFLSSFEESLSSRVTLQNRANTILTNIDREELEIENNLSAVVNTLLPRSFTISRIRYNLARISQTERTLLLGVNMRHITGEDLAAFNKQQYESIDESVKNIAKAIDDFERTLTDSENREAWDAFKVSLLSWGKIHTKFLERTEKLFDMAKDLIRGGPQFTKELQAAYEIIFVEGKAARQECEQRLEALNNITQKAADQYLQKTVGGQAITRSQIENLINTQKDSTQRAEQLRDKFAATVHIAINKAHVSENTIAEASNRFGFTTLLSIIGMMITAVIGIIIAWRVTKPIQKIVGYMSNIASGDFSQDIPAAAQQRKDEVGMLAKGLQEIIHSTRTEIHMADSMAKGDYTVAIPIRSRSDQLGQALNVMLNNTNNTLSSVSGTIEHINNGMSTVLQAASSLAVSAKSAADAVNDISSAVRHVDQQAQENALHATEASELAIAGSDAAERGYTAMSDLVTAMGETRQSSVKIQAVAKLIDDIAFQTNLLALNAAVEAARAGRHGRGFSVVADEVRNLAGRSAKAARETGEMIRAMTERMETEEKMATRSDQEFRDIVKTIQKVSGIVDEISQSSSTQSGAIAQITKNLERIDKVVQQTTDHTGRTAKSAQILSNHVDELRRIIGKFKLFGGQRRLSGYQNDIIPLPPPPAPPEPLPVSISGRKSLPQQTENLALPESIEPTGQATTLPSVK